MTPLAPLITRFLREYMPNQRGYSPETCDTYAVSLRLLLEYAAERLGTRPSRLLLEQLNASLMVDFLTYIERERGNSISTRNLRLAAIRALMRYVEHHVPSALAQVAQIDAIPVKRHEQKLVRHLTMDEVRAILNARTSRRARASGTGRCCTCASPAACASPSWSACFWRTSRSVARRA
jgi:integrase/recombinase XerD